MQKILIYDCEIIKCIPDKIKDPRFNYCQGWTDFKNMGISVIGTWRNFRTKNNEEKYKAYVNSRSKIGCMDISWANFFFTLVAECDLLIGFNSVSFDDNLINNNISSAQTPIKTNFDLLREVRIASGEPPEYTKGVTKGGLSFNELAQLNLEIAKSGDGQLAPKLWQLGHQDKVVNYCLNDVAITKELYFKFINEGLTINSTQTIKYEKK
jgi:hypothetical protein